MCIRDSDTIGNHLIEHSSIAVGGSLEVDIPVGLGGINILVGVAVLLDVYKRQIYEGLLCYARMEKSFSSFLFLTNS